ncbi:G-protein coupled receptor Mth2 isoform X2 [Colletes latitarsis]|uniref:G-protein coupled receptor Mth2 isoform X2 n=1 Tax=Colletes latitarsis TaxID=2605962 RepID=UPI004036011F
MTMRSLIPLALVWVSTVLSATETTFNKCCPHGEIFSDKKGKACVPAPSNAMELYSIGYDTSFPNCTVADDIRIKLLSSMQATGYLRPSCLEILYQRDTRKSDLIVVGCQSNEDSPKEYIPLVVPLPRLLSVRRCCPKNTVFDVATKSCVSLFDVIGDGNYSNVDEFISLLPEVSNEVDFFNVFKGTPDCGREAMFTYEVNVKNIIFENGLIKVKLPSLDNKSNEWFDITAENSCVDLTKDSRRKRQLVVRVCRSSKSCQSHSCVKKCCPENEGFTKSWTSCSKIAASDSPSIFYQTVSRLTNGTWNDTGSGIWPAIKCEFGMYGISGSEIFGLTPEGYLVWSSLSSIAFHNEYCLEVVHNGTSLNETTHILAKMCFPEPTKEPAIGDFRFKVNSILEMISCFFLLLTLLVYICLPTLQNLHGKTLMCHAASLLMSYVCLAIMPWLTPTRTPHNTHGGSKYCTVLGIVMYFSFLSTFSWLNIMCFDIWRTFGRLRGNVGRGRSHNKKFLLYCLYAWGLALSITLFAILSDNLYFLPEYLKPNFGSLNCWFSSKGELIFFRGPVGIQLISNVVFFILTADHCNKVKAEIRRVADPSDPRSKRFHADKTKLIMIVKLFVVMGIFWILEIVSSIMNMYTNFSWRYEAFYPSDVINCLQGLLIFILFVMKPRVYQALRNRCGFNDKKQKSSNQGISMPQDPFKVKKSASSSTLTSSYAVSSTP